MKKTTPTEINLKRIVKIVKRHAPVDVSTVATYLRVSDTRALQLLKILVKDDVLTCREESLEEAVRRFRARPRTPFYKARFRKRTVYMFPDRKWYPATVAHAIQLNLELNEHE